MHVSKVNARKRDTGTHLAFVPPPVFLLNNFKMCWMLHTFCKSCLMGAGMADARKVVMSALGHLLSDHSKSDNRAAKPFTPAANTTSDSIRAGSSSSSFAASRRLKEDAADEAVSTQPEVGIISPSCRRSTIEQALYFGGMAVPAGVTAKSRSSIHT